MAISFSAVVWTGAVCALAAGLTGHNLGRSRQRLNLDATRAPFAVLSHAHLPNASLTRADFHEASLDGADLENSDLSGANLQLANLVGARLRGARLCGTDLRATTLLGADLGQADLRGAIYDESTSWPDRFDPEAAGAVLGERIKLPFALEPRMLQEMPWHRSSRVSKTRPLD